MSYKQNIKFTSVSLLVLSFLTTSALANDFFNSQSQSSSSSMPSNLSQLGNNQKKTVTAVNRVANILKANTYTQLKQDYLGLPDAQNIIDNAKSFVIGMNGLNNVGDIFSVPSSIKLSLQYFHNAFVPIVYENDKQKPKAKPVATPVSGATPYSYASIYIIPPGSMAGSFPGLPGFPGLGPVMPGADKLGSGLCSTSDDTKNTTGQNAVLGPWCHQYDTAEQARKRNLQSLLYTNITQPGAATNTVYEQEAKSFISALMTDQTFNKNLLGQRLSNQLKSFREKITTIMRGDSKTNKQKVYQQIAILSKDPGIAHYIINIRSVLVMKSMLLNYFDHLISMNIKLKNGQPSTDKDAKSPNQLLKSMAVTPLNHVDQINTASPATISRMTLLALQRNNYLLYQLHQDMTRQSGLIAIKDVSLIKSAMESQMMKQVDITNTVKTAIKNLPKADGDDDSDKSSDNSSSTSQDAANKAKSKAAQEKAKAAQEKAEKKK